MNLEILEPRICYIVMKKKSKVGEHILLDFKTCYKTIKTNQCGSGIYIC